MRSLIISTPRDIIRVIKSRGMRWAGHVGRMGKKRNTCKGLVAKTEGRRPLTRPKHRWDIKMDLKEIGWERCGLDSSGSGESPVSSTC
jgi:hypothetical protein